MKDEGGEPDCDPDPDSPEGDKKSGGRDIIKRRQLISHLFNLENLLRRNFTLQQIADLQNQFDSLNTAAAPVPLIDQLLANLEVKGAMERFATGITRVRDRQDTVHGGVFDVRGLLTLIADEHKAKLREKCTFCDVGFKTPSVVPVLLEEVRLQRF